MSGSNLSRKGVTEGREKEESEEATGGWHRKFYSRRKSESEEPCCLEDFTFIGPCHLSAFLLFVLTCCCLSALGLCG